MYGAIYKFLFTYLLTIPIFHVASPDRSAQVSILSRDAITAESNEVVDVHWSPALLQNADPTSNLVDISIHELSADGSLRFLHTLATDIPNSGSAQVKIELDGPVNDVDEQPITPVFFQISLAQSHVTKRKRALPLLGSLAIWSVKRLLKKVVRDAALHVACEAWHFFEDPGIGETLLTETVCCPRTAREARFPSSGLQEESGLSEIPQFFFHPDANTCFRQTTPR